MFTLPQLAEEDFNCFNSVLAELLNRSEASTALLTDKAGFRLVEQGDVKDLDTSALAALASGSFMATQEIARIIHEPNFNSVYQQGEKYSLLVCNVDEQSVLVVIFPASVSVGAAKFYSTAAIEAIAGQLKKAKERAPDAGIDLAMANVADSADFFKRKQ